MVASTSTTGSRSDKAPLPASAEPPQAAALHAELRSLIASSRQRLAGVVNAELTRLYWAVGHRLHTEVLGGAARATYGDKLIDRLGEQLAQEFSRGFEAKNLRRMVQFAQVFAEPEIVATLSRQLSWSHFVNLLPLKTAPARQFYAHRAAQDGWSVRELRQQIERKAYERTELANKLTVNTTEMVNGQSLLVAGCKCMHCCPALMNFLNAQCSTLRHCFKSMNTVMQGIDIFSGAGGMSIGAGACGIDVQYAVEFDARAADTFSINHPNTTLYKKDIRNISGSDFLNLDRTQPLILFGGPPCQGFSTSNQKNRQFNNEKNWLFKEYLRIVEEIRPDWVVFENVKGLLETEGGYFLDAVLNGFKEFGYTTNHFILNSENYGVPQRRNRLFIVGCLHGKSINSPNPTSKNPVTVRQALSDLPDLKNGDTPDEMEYGKIARTNYAKLLRGSLSKCHNNLVTNNAPYIIERYSYIPQGGNWEDIPSRLMQNYTDRTRCHTGIYRRLKEDEPSVVIGNFRKNMLIHPWQDRGLSVREAARLQSFPDWFRFSGSIGFQQQQVGNAVPPMLAKAVFTRIIEAG